MATMEIINTGSQPNDGSGDPLRVAFEKVNNNFANLFATGFNTITSITDGNSTQEILSYPANAFTQATFQINSSDESTTDSQNITINASINTDSDDVKYTMFGTLIHGNAVCDYDMDVVSGNVILYAQPFVIGEMKHFIAYQVTFDPMLLGTPMITENTNDEIITETFDNIITTEN
jgi:hypothetical protein